MTKLNNTQERLFISSIILLIGALTAIDIIEDLIGGKPLEHLGLDIAVALASFFVVIYLLLKMKSEREKIATLYKEQKYLVDITANLKTELKNQSHILVNGLSQMIDQEFENWALSPAEREVAMFLLKGLSASEMANIRGSSEKTIRHQITSIYKKAGLKGRQELQAFFLEDLLQSGPGHE